MGVRQVASVALGLLAVLSVVVYAPAMMGPFLFDDLVWFRGQEGDTPFPSLISWARPQTRPLVQVSFAVTDRVLGHDSFGRHAGNLCIHIIVGFIGFGLALRLFRRAGMCRVMRCLAGLTVAGAWLVHPLNTQAVAYVVQRAESLMGLCFFAFLYVALASARTFNDEQLAVEGGKKVPIKATKVEGTARLPWKAVSLCLIGLFAAGIYSKTVAVALVVVGPLLDFSALGWDWRQWVRRRAWAYGPVLVLGAFASVILLPDLIEAKAGVGFGGDAPPVGVYLMTQLRSISQYARLSVWPVGLSIDRGPHFVTDIWSVFFPAVGLTLWLALAGWLWWTAGGSQENFSLRIVSWAMVSPLLVLAPSSSFVPTADPMFEHRMYVPLFFLCFLAVWAAIELGNWVSRRFDVPIGRVHRSLTCLAVVVIVALAVRTYDRTSDYASLTRIWETALRVDADNDRAATNFVTAMHEEGRSAELPAALVSLIDHAAARGQSTDVLVMNLAMTGVSRGRATDVLPALREIASRVPATNELYTYRQRRDAATRYVNLAIAAQRAGELSEAEQAISRAIAIDDTPPYAHAIAGHISKSRGDLETARRHWQRALDLNPEPWPELESDLQRLPPPLGTETGQIP